MVRRVSRISFCLRSILFRLKRSFDRRKQTWPAIGRWKSRPRRASPAAARRPRQAAVQAERYAELAKQGITSREQTEQFRTAAEGATAALNADVSALESARAAIRADEARVAEAKLSLGYAKIMLQSAGTSAQS